MKFKVFKLKNGKLEYAGIREVQAGDIIVEGQTSMAEVSLRESATPPTRKELSDAALAVKAEKERQGKEALKAALKRAMPNATEQGLDAAVNLKRPPAPW
jgi:hypothetical protein